MKVVSIRIFYLFIVCFSLAQEVLTNNKMKMEIVNNILSSYPTEREWPPIIERNEFYELQILPLINKLDRTITSFGLYGMNAMMYPICDRIEIEKRQHIIRYLVEHEDVHQELFTILRDIEKSQSALLSYWNPYDEINLQTQRLYFSSWLPKKVINYLNDSETGLEVTVLCEAAGMVKSLLQFQIMSGIYNNVLRILYGEETHFDLKKSILDGLREPIRVHSLEREVFTERHERVMKRMIAQGITNGYGLYLKAIMTGTFADRYYALLHGFKRAITIRNPLTGNVWTYNETAGLSRYGDKLNRGIIFSEQCSAALAATLYAAWYDANLLYTLKGIYERGKTFLELMKGLHNRKVLLSRLFKHIERLSTFLDKHACLRESDAAKQLQMFIKGDQLSDRMKRLRTLIQSFTIKDKIAYIYHHGRVLLVHRLLHQTKDELVPVMKAIAECDAYFSIALLYKQHSNTAYPFSFIEFVDQEHAMVTFEHCWLPLMPLERQMAHDITMGADQASKVLLTGPNGSGKSTFLKAIGQAVVLAHSCGIVPAKHARMTVFDGLRTCFVPAENLQEGLSTFMAEDKRMNEVEQFIHETKGYKKYLALIDEPWRGTEPAVSGEYIYQFGSRIAHDVQSIALITTHVRKPIDLEADTQGKFANMQVVINENQQGFERTFTIKSGPALWWFDDAQKRLRFVEWLKKRYTLVGN